MKWSSNTVSRGTQKLWVIVGMRSNNSVSLRPLRDAYTYFSTWGGRTNYILFLHYTQISIEIIKSSLRRIEEGNHNNSSNRTMWIIWCFRRCFILWWCQRTTDLTGSIKWWRQLISSMVWISPYEYEWRGSSDTTVQISNTVTHFTVK